MSFFTGLRCRMCGTPFPAEALFVCDQCLGPLEVTYDYDAIRGAVTRDEISARPEPFSFSSFAAVATMRAPVAANGWPIASDEPTTLSLLRSIAPSGG